jgi:Tfp pilus assembly protein PilE
MTPQSRHRPRRGFTLIELLVVIATTDVLVAASSCPPSRRPVKQWLG